MNSAGIVGVKEAYDSPDFEGRVPGIHPLSYLYPPAPLFQFLDLHVTCVVAGNEKFGS